jgi:hypothetical protein
MSIKSLILRITAGGRKTWVEMPEGGYTHPATHPATMITEDTAHKFVSDTDKEKIDKAGDVTGKVDKITGHSLVDDNDIRNFHAPGSDNQDLSGKVDKETGKGLSANDFTDALKTSYDGAVTHGGSTHAPSNAQKNSDITKGEVEAVLTGELTSHSHASQTWKTGIATKNITDVSAVQNIAHGLGRIPKYVRIDGAIIITAAITQLATGIFDGTNNSGLTVAIGEGTSTAATDAVYTSTSIALGFSPLVATNVFTGANRQTGVISVDATNIIITWTKTGTVGSLVASLIWQCT